jgi:glycosyltransferase involved in cell wall biosynthesis
MISVIMSIYNEPEDWIKSSINSILDQTFKDFEFIIINDNPLKKSNSLILNYFKSIDDRIFLITNKKNIGLTKSLNKGVKYSSRKYIARMDADDICFKNRFELQLNFLEDNLDYILCGSSRIDFNNETSKEIILPKKDEDIKTELLLRNCITHPTVMLRSCVFKIHNISYDENIKKSQDYNLWVKISHLGKFKNLETPLIKYRLSNNQISNINYSNQYYYSRLNRKLYIKKYFNKLNIDITQEKSFNEILSLYAPSNIKEIYISSYMIFNDKHKIKVYFMFLFRLNFFLFIKVHKFFLVDLINNYKLNVKK